MVESGSAFRTVATMCVPDGDPDQRRRNLWRLAFLGERLDDHRLPVRGSGEPAGAIHHQIQGQCVPTPRAGRDAVVVRLDDR